MRTARWVAFGAVVVCAAGVGWDHVRYAGRVLPGVWVEGVPAGGLTAAQLRAQLLAAADRHLRARMVVRAGHARWEVQAAELGLRWDVDDAVRQAYRIGRHPNPIRRVQERWELWREGVVVRVPRRVEPAPLRAFLHRVGAAVGVPARDARLVVRSGKVEVVPGRTGRALDWAAAGRRLRAAVLRSAREVELPVRVVRPRWTEERLAALGIAERVASFTTHLTRDPDRTHNVVLAAFRLRGVLLPTGAELSFNRAVGPRTKEAGFREAPVLVEDELVPGDGGGVCQVSSTLFNAALLADLTVTRRANHTQPVGYVPLGRDATVVYGWLDLRVRNEGPPLLLWTEVQGDRLTVSFYGPPRPHRRVRVVVTGVERIPPPAEPVVRADPELTPGAVRVVPARPGYRATTVREVWEAGKLVRQEVVARSVYRPVPQILRVGVGGSARTAPRRALRP